MSQSRRGLRLARWFLLATLAVGLLALPAAGEEGEEGKVPAEFLEHLSESPVLAYYLAHPDAAPARMDEFRRMPEARHVQSCGAEANKDSFNCDIFGLPQNEESMTACPTNDNLVLEGTNDYRGLIDPEGNFTGWHWSTDGGHSITNEGLLPPVTLVRTNPGHEVPSGGDPVDFIPAPCDFVYAASLAYDPVEPFGNPNGIALYRSTPEILSTCEPFVEDPEEEGSIISNPACWPQRRLVAETDATHFLDKEWMYVGYQNGVRYVWVTYTDFAQDPDSPLGFTGAEIKAVRCDENLVTCTEPILISETDPDVQFSDVTIGPDGRAVITWARIDGELEQTEQIFTIKYRSETAPGSGVFGPTRVVHVEDRAIPFGGFLHANDFRIATYPKNDVTMVDGHPRVWVIWDACGVRLLETVCEESEIKLKYSDDDGVTWTGPIVLSKGGDNYFPTIAAYRTTNSVGPRLGAAWFSNANDVQFHNAQDVVATGINYRTGAPTGLKRITQSSNETEADPLLGGVFIGDYIEAAFVGTKFYVGYNANYRKVPLLGGFLNEEEQPVIPVNQQDNYVAITSLN